MWPKKWISEQSPDLIVDRKESATRTFEYIYYVRFHSLQLYYILNCNLRSFILTFDASIGSIIYLLTDTHM